MSKKVFTDKELGMDRAINRRDFLSGASIAVTGTILSPSLVKAMESLEQKKPAQDRADYYPPGKIGMRGSHAGSFEAAHSVRDGNPIDVGVSTGEEFDLVVVGGGLVVVVVVVVVVVGGGDTIWTVKALA